MLSKLGAAEYGLYTLSASTISYLGLLSFGFGAAYMRYYARYNAKNDQEKIASLNGMFMTIFLIIALLVIAGGVILVLNVRTIFSESLSNNELDRARIIMSVMVLNLALTFPSSVFGSYVTAHERFFFQRTLQMICSICTPVTMFIILLLGYKSVAMSVLTTVWTLIQFCARAYYCYSNLGMRFNFRMFDLSLMREMTGFSFFIFLNSFIDTVNWGIDKFLLGIYKGTIAVAVYGVASTFNTYFLSFSTTVSGVFIPRVNNIVARNEKNANQELTELLTKVGRIQFMILMLVFTGFGFFGKDFIIMYWGGKDYKDAYYMAMILMGTVLIPLCQNVGIEIQRAKNKHQFRSVVYTVIAFCNLFISIPLCKAYGGVGCAIGTGIALIVGNGIVMNIFYHKKLGLNMFFYWKQILSILPACIIPLTLGYIVVHLFSINHLLELLLLIIVYTLIYIVCLWKIGLNAYEKELFKKPFIKIRNKVIR